MSNNDKKNSNEKESGHPAFEDDQIDKHNKQLSEIEQEKIVRKEAEKERTLAEKVQGITDKGEELFLEEQRKEFADKRMHGDSYKNDVKDILKSITENSNKSNNRSLANHIKLGDVLYDAKVKLGLHFSVYITEEMISAKQTQRYIKLIITKDSEETYSKLRKAGKENFEVIKKDTRITNLDESQIASMTKPSMVKIMRMKELGNKEFAEVLGGNDARYKQLVKRDSKAKREKNEKELMAKKPDGMDEAVYKEFLKKGVHYVLDQFQIQINNNAVLVNKNAELVGSAKAYEAAIKHVAGAKLYTSSGNSRGDYTDSIEADIVETKQLENAAH